MRLSELQHASYLSLYLLFAYLLQFSVAVWVQFQCCEIVTMRLRFLVRISTRMGIRIKGPETKSQIAAPKQRTICDISCVQFVVLKWEPLASIFVHVLSKRGTYICTSYTEILFAKVN